MPAVNLAQKLEIITTDQPSDELIDFLDAQLSAFNIEVTGYRDFKKLAVVYRDPNDEIVAGLSGYTWGFVCKVQLLWVARANRGAGSGLFKGRLL